MFASLKDSALSYRSFFFLWMTLSHHLVDVSGTMDWHSYPKLVLQSPRTPFLQYNILEYYYIILEYYYNLFPKNNQGSQPRFNSRKFASLASFLRIKILREIQQSWHSS